MLRSLPWGLAAALGLLGCYGGMSPREDLQFAVREYADGIRWGKVDQSALHLPLEIRRKFAEKYSSLEDELEVHDYELQRMELDTVTHSAEVRLDVSWSLKRQGLLQRTTLQQHWERDRQSGAWILMKQTVLRGAKLELID